MAFASASASVIDRDPTVATTSPGADCFGDWADVEQAASATTPTAAQVRACMEIIVSIVARPAGQSRSGISATTYAMTATAAAHLAISIGSILSIVSADV